MHNFQTAPAYNQHLAYETLSYLAEGDHFVRKRELVYLVFSKLVTCALSFMVCLFFPLVSLVDYDM